MEEKPNKVKMLIQKRLNLDESMFLMQSIGAKIYSCFGFRCILMGAGTVNIRIATDAQEKEIHCS